MTATGPEPIAPEPIAIVGIGCRFPGAAGPQAFWSLLAEGREAICPVPPDRWNEEALHHEDPVVAPGTIRARRGGFLDRIDLFDAGFFGISPREAQAIDPQQRLLLETSFEALEDGGLDPARFRGQKVGVFIGIAAYDYAEIQHAPENRHLIGPHTNTGLALSIAANRISYIFDFRGPSISVDTACSSSLVAVHLAVQSLRNGESAIALAGGVNAILKPEATIGFSRAAMLAPDGRCKTFDAGANGYARGEGCGVIVLKRLADAVRNSDHIYALIQGSAVNQDGSTNGISLPSQDAQEAALREALAVAGLDPATLQYVEAHGTGTPVGDPIEARALGRVLGEGRDPAAPCRLGSVKTNIGHLESAAGIAGLIKAALSIERRVIPASLNFTTPNPEIPFADLKLRVAARAEPWPAPDRKARAGVNSFGFGGTNAHVVIEEAPAPSIGPRDTGDGPWLLPLSAATPLAFEQSRLAHVRHVEELQSQDEIASLCYWASVRRPHSARRAAVLGRTAGDLAAALRRLEPAMTGANAEASGPAPIETGPVFVYSGMGPQWWGMGRELLASESVFREALEECDAAYRRLSGWSLLSAFQVPETDSAMARTEVAQPCNFALQVALTRLWRSWGIAPGAILGHSAGEVAAAHAAGVLSLDEAAAVAYHRSRLQSRTAGQGRMAACGLSEEEAILRLAPCAGRLSLAAVNGAQAVTLSGDEAALADLVAALEREGRFAKLLRVDVPYHSHYMDPLEAELRASLATLEPKVPTVPFYSTVTGEEAGEKDYDGDYWWRNIRQPVLFAKAAQAIAARHHDTFLEIGPHPVLGSAILEGLSNGGRPFAALASLRRETGERASLLASLGRLYERGFAVDWRGVYPHPRPFVRLPLHAWDRQSYWHESSGSRAARLAAPAHPLLGRRVDGPGAAWRNRLDPRRIPALADHRVEGAIVLPGAAYVELALAVAAEVLDDGKGRQGPFVIEDLAFERALVLPEAGSLQIKVTYDPERAQLAVYAGGEGEPWECRARAAIRAGTAAPRCLDLVDLRRRCDRHLPDPYPRFHAAGLEYGPAFRGIRELWSGEGEALALLRPPAGATMGNFLPPDLLDAAFQTLLGALGHHADPQPAYLPVAIERLRLPAPLRVRHEGELYAYARVTRQSAATIAGEIRLLDETGSVLAEVMGFTGRRISGAAAGRAILSDHLYQFRWRAAARPDLAPPIQALPSPDEIAAQVRARQEELIDPAERECYYMRVEPALDLAAARIAALAFARLGQKLDPEHPRTAAALLGAGDGANRPINGHHRRLLRRMLTMLEATGVAKSGPDGFRLNKAFAGDEDVAALLDPLQRKFPLYEPEIEILHRCGEALAPIIRGEAESHEILFPEGSLVLTEKIYRRSRSFGLYHALAREALRELLDSLPATAILHVLEIGGGTGSLTAEVLDLLAPGRTNYTFTDISPGFTQKAAQQFAAYPFLEYRTLDLEQDPEAQGFAPRSFHLVLAGDVLHATKNLGSSLDRVRRLLAPGGMLLAPELTRPPYWFDLVFGLLAGWWLFEDRELRPDHACISGAAWRRLLTERGFAEVELLRDAEGPKETLHSVLLAQTDGTAERIETKHEHAPDMPGNWLILGEMNGAARQMEIILGQRGQKFLAKDAGANEAFDEILAHAGDLRGVIFFAGRSAFNEGTTAAGALATATASTGLALRLMQRLAVANEANSVTAPPCLFLVTAGAEAVLEGDRVDPVQAALWGLGRVFLNEHPEIRSTLIDLGAEPSVSDLAALAAICLAPDEESEIALRNGAQFVHRLERIAPEAMAPTSLRQAAAEEPFELGYGRSGALDNLRVQETRRRPPGPGEVEIRTAAAGLNFRDIMKLLGIYPSEDAERPILGDEAAGTIVALGAGVKDLAAGDRVVAIGPGFRRYLTLDRRLVARLPDGVDFAAGATLPIAFLTAHYALRHLARLAPGESLLVHAGAGGVGQAALQIGRLAGARLFATAGSEDKRAFLRAQGIEHVFDSRSLDFADEIREVTAGQGVDVVLNSLSGQAIAKSLSLLRPYGRFLEIGKTDIYRDSPIGLKPFRHNLSYFAIDLDALFHQRPAQAGGLLNEIMSEVQAGNLAPLEHKIFPLSRAAQAFRHMAQAKHIGKVTIDFADPATRIAPRHFAALPARADGLYLITGGLGGLGRRLAGWLIDQGARHIVLLGRHGIADAAVAAEIEQLRARGAEIDVISCDIADEAALGRVLQDLRRRGLALRGLIHGAMVLDDGLIAQLDPLRFERVLRPKIAGAVALHRLTLEDPLDFFVLFSSFAATIGNIGQGNYAAANTFLGALAHYRRSLGRPALAVDWGAIASAGYVAEHAGIEQHFRRQGLSAFPPEQAFAALAAMLEQDSISLGLVAIDWAAWSRHAPAIAASPRFRSLVEGSSRDTARNTDAKPVLERLKSAAATERPGILIHLMQEQLAAVLGLAAEQIDAHKPPNALGLDSLMAVEFGCLIEDRLGFKPATLELIQAPSLALLAERFIEKVAL